MLTARILVLCITWAFVTPVLGAQVVAYQLHYPVWLGAPVLRLGRLWLYGPQHYALWYWRYAWYYPVPFEWGLGIMLAWLVGGAVGVAVFLKRQGWRRRPIAADVDWAGPKEIRKANLFARVPKA
jgi:hypothetical protein